MGLNFACACHRCREALAISRGDEHQGLHSFFTAHKECVRLSANRYPRDPYIEIQGDYIEQDWMDASSGYTQYWFSTTEPRYAGVGNRAEPWHMGYRVHEPVPASDFAAPSH